MWRIGVLAGLLVLWSARMVGFFQATGRSAVSLAKRR